MEPRYFTTIDGDVLSRANLLRFIRAFFQSSGVREGYYLEFGVLNGHSLVETYALLRGMLTHLYGFDTFAGLPELSSADEAALGLMPQFHAGNFKSMPAGAVRDFVIASTSGLGPDGISLIEGPFERTLPAFEKSTLRGKGQCLVAHVDCDLYSSSADVFRFLDGIVETGTWLLLDDYWTYRGSPKHGQRRAFEEWMATSTRVGASEYSSYNGFCKAFILYEK